MLWSCIARYSYPSECVRAHKKPERARLRVVLAAATDI
jgi:hypothetical protein